MSFTIYQASAGSGKTFSLAKEYLKITLQDPDLYKNILAITFTNKAASEMKERILSYLTDLDSGDLASDGYTKMLPLVMEETGLDEKKAVENSKILLKKIIYGYADFSIMTIDAFYQRILRTFAYDLDIPINFQLEIDHKELIEQVVELLIEQVGENDSLTKMMIEFINSNSEDSKSWHIEKDIIGFTPELFREQSKFFIDSLQSLTLNDFTSIISNYIKEKDSLKLKVVQDVAKMKSLLELQSIPIDSFFRDFISKWFATVLKEEYKIGVTLKKVLIDKNWFSKKAETQCLNLFQAIENEFTLLLEQNIEDVRRIQFISAIQKKIFPMALLNELKGMLNQIEATEHTFQISNTNFKLNEITSQEEAPFIYERLGDKYFYYFIDEFQDTSRLQWLNILPLICEALSGYHGTNRGMAILFGDPKQAIYRFRAGDIEQFVTLPAIPNPENSPIIQQMESTISGQYQSIALDTNYRSLENIIEFNNALFEQIATEYQCIQPVYKNHKQKFIASKSGGIVTVNILAKQKQLQDGYNFLDFVLSQVELKIEASIQNGFQFKDIAILTRDKRHTPEIASFLSRKGYTVISSDSLLIQSSLKVLFVISLLRYHENHKNQVQAFSVFVKFCQLFNIENRLSDSRLLSINFMESQFRSNGFAFEFQLLNSLNIYEKTEYIIRAFQLNNTSDIYLLALLNEMDKYAQSQKPEYKFWEWWDEKCDSLSVEIPDDMDGINLMTIHKSKGLEFPIVIFPDFDSSNKNGDIWVNLSSKIDEFKKELKVAQLPVKADDDTEFSAEVTEELNRIIIDKVNVLYVALTRAVEQLHILIPSPPEKSSSFSYKSSICTFVNDSLLFQPVENDYYTTYTFGQNEVKKSKVKSNVVNKIEVNSLNSKDWKSNNWLSSDYQESEAQQFGKMLHNVMSQIQTYADLDEALIFANRMYALDNSALEILKKSVLAILNHEKLARLFNSNSTVYNEMDVVDEFGVVYRPDRVVCIDNEAIILDFKTGVKQEYYYHQINSYKDLYLKLGYQTVNGYLVYTNSNGVEIEVV